MTNSLTRSLPSLSANGDLVLIYSAMPIAAFDTLEKQSSQYKVFILNYKKFSSSIKLLQSLSQRDYFGIKNIVLFHSMEENGRNKLLAMVPNAEERVICIPAGEREIIKTYLEVKTLRPFANIFRVTHV